jgi:DNA topoisomerase-1
MSASGSSSNAVAVARQAGLRHVSDQTPGIRRTKAGGTAFVYRKPGGGHVSQADMQRIRRLAIPPAWTEVWICPHENGHIQATGRDARGRKQYRYHERWRATRDEAKFDRVLDFGEALPRIRRSVAAHLKRPGMDRRKVMATIVRLLERTLIRVGNDEYARHNGSYGLTTLRNHHAKIRGTQIVFEFKGKSGKRHRVGVQDARLAKLVRRCQELPGQELFGYVDEGGVVRDVSSGDVNDYLREIAGSDFSAKDFRTWAGTVMAASALRELGGCQSARQAKRNIVQVVEQVARALGNTPAICRRCYVHPAILDGYIAGRTIDALCGSNAGNLRKVVRKLRTEELDVMRQLRKQLRRAKAHRPSTS